jgi:hypothetical protein
VGGQFQCPLESVYQIDLYHGAACCTFDIGINIHTPTDVESEIMSENGDEPCCKITRVARAHHIRDVDTKLLQQREQGASLRELAIFFNKQVLSNALDRATQEVIGDAETIYEVLMDEDTDRAREAELRSKLARYNVDIDDVQRDFISHQTVRNHLNGCREIDTERESTLTIEGGQKTIEWAQARSEGVIEQTIERLRNAGEVADTQTEVTQSVRVACSACGQSYRIDAFLEQGGCSCHPDSD